MRVITIKDEFYKMCKSCGCDEELLYNKGGRPCVLLIQLKYKKKYHNFAVPLRSNISANIPKDQYFSLPPTKNTRTRNRHGIHYIKLLPITNKYILPYYDCNKTVMKILETNNKKIVAAVQQYLYEYEKGNGHSMTPRIDDIIDLLAFDKRGEGKENDAN